MSAYDTANIKPKPLPEKKKGRHRFIAMASFILSDEAAYGAYGGSDMDAPILDGENLWDLSVGCIDCEQPMSPDLKKYCDAPAYMPPS